MNCLMAGMAIVSMIGKANVAGGDASVVAGVLVHHEHGAPGRPVRGLSDELLARGEEVEARYDHRAPEDLTTPAMAGMAGGTAVAWDRGNAEMAAMPEMVGMPGMPNMADGHGGDAEYGIEAHGHDAEGDERHDRARGRLVLCGADHRRYPSASCPPQAALRAYASSICDSDIRNSP